MSRDPIAAVPAWRTNAVPVLLATETELPSSFSGVKYHCENVRDSVNFPIAEMNSDVHKATKRRNQNLESKYTRLSENNVKRLWTVHVHVKVHVIAK